MSSLSYDVHTYKIRRFTLEKYSSAYFDITHTRVERFIIFFTYEYAKTSETADNGIALTGTWYYEQMRWMKRREGTQNGPFISIFYLFRRTRIESKYTEPTISINKSDYRVLYVVIHAIRLNNDAFYFYLMSWPNRRPS